MLRLCPQAAGWKRADFYNVFVFGMKLNMWVYLLIVLLMDSAWPEMRTAETVGTGRWAGGTAWAGCHPSSATKLYLAARCQGVCIINSTLVLMVLSI